MTDTNGDDVTELEEIVVVGQRRPAGSTGAYGGGGGGGRGSGAEEQLEVSEDPDPDDGPGYDPCGDPATKLDWNADAAAAEATAEFERRAAARNPPETLNDREWGAALFQMPDGRVVVGNITSGQFTFQNPGPGGRASVAIDWTAPAGGLLVGMIHSHNAGGHIPSGSSATSDDQANLSYIRDVRGQANADRDQARIYIAALTTGPAGAPQNAKINVYDHRNQDAAIAGQEGPEVNPLGQPCPT